MLDQPHTELNRPSSRFTVAGSTSCAADQSLRNSCRSSARSTSSPLKKFQHQDNYPHTTRRKRRCVSWKISIRFCPNQISVARCLHGTQLKMTNVSSQFEI